MGTYLDLDDVAATSPLAMRELAELRDELQELRIYRSLAAVYGLTIFEELEGWRLVPIVPTEEMLLANGTCSVPAGQEWLKRDARETWERMLAAVPVERTAFSDETSEPMDIDALVDAPPAPRRQQKSDVDI